MTKLPQISGTRLVRALRRAGFREVHRKGSHVMLAHAADSTRIAVVPTHKAKMRFGGRRGDLITQHREAA